MKPQGLLAILVWLSACSGDAELADIHEFIQAVQQQPAVEQAAPVATRAEPGFAYGAAALRSPFAPSTHGPAAKPDRKTAARPPVTNRRLETFSLAALVGTLHSERGMVALLEDRAGRVQQVQVGDYLGDQWGQVVGITDTHLELRQLVADGQGGWFEQQTQLEFPPEE